MLAQDQYNMLLCGSSERDPQPPGQLSADTRPLSGFCAGPAGHLESASPGALAGGGHRGANRRVPHQRTSSAPGSPVVVHCVNCRAGLRWSGQRSTRTHCPKCHCRLILRLDTAGHWAAFPENDDSVAGMICDWLGRRCDNDESDS